MSSALHDPSDRHFERLYRHYARDVYRFVLAVVRNPTEAEDVTQTAFLNAYRAFKRGERPESPRSWLIAIAHNAIRSRHRFRLRRPREVPFDETLLDLPVAAEERETVAEVLEALGELPVNQREALAMRELEGRSYPEIAETLGVSVPAVESLIFRARRTLRKQRTSLRGLTVVQLPRSLRTLFQTQSDAVGAGLAAKAAVVVAAASVLAGGVIGPGDAGASQHPTTLGRHEPSRALVAPRRAATHATAAATRTAGPTGHTAPKAKRQARSAAPPAGPAPAPLVGVAPPSVTTRSGGVVQTPAPAPPEAAPAPAAPAATVPDAAAPVTGTVTSVTTAVANAVTNAVSTLPAVTPPQLPPVTVPALPSVPPPPELPPPPSVPQVPGPGGIK